VIDCALADAMRIHLISSLADTPTPPPFWTAQISPWELIVIVILPPITSSSLRFGSNTCNNQSMLDRETQIITIKVPSGKYVGYQLWDPGEFAQVEAKFKVTVQAQVNVWKHKDMQSNAWIK
jgi:hypothetical protein